jgi:hypothetical protein
LRAKNELENVKLLRRDVKIFAFLFKGEYLTAGAPCQDGATSIKRVVCLMRENDSNEQLWRIDKHPGDPIKRTICTRQRTKEVAQL